LWCYAKETTYQKNDEMSLEFAKKLVDLSFDMGARNIIIIGGEPTFWRHLFRLSEYIHKKDMTSGLVTNGFLLSKRKYFKELLDSNIDFVNVSLKAGNRAQQKELTKTDSFDDVKKGITNLSNSNMDFDIAITINSLILNNLEEVIATAYSCGTKNISLQFCSTTFSEDEPNKGYMVNPHILVKKIVKAYGRLDAPVKQTVSIEQSLPECIWPKDFLNKLRKDGKISNGCHLTRKEGLIFNTDGSLIPCNCLGSFPLGKYGVDFTDFLTLKNFWEGGDIKEFYEKIISFPSTKCIKCNDYDLCGGGCPLQWFVFKPDDVINNFSQEIRP
jgi:radical SAM protein with 4Fe4S-binding SPASM domain